MASDASGFDPLTHRFGEARSTVHNQRRELCMEGEQKYLVRKRHPGA